MSSSQSHRQSEIPASEQDILSLMQRIGGLFKFLIPVLIAAVDVGVQGRSTAPSETHAANFYAFILSTSIYASAVTTKNEHLGLLAFISGFLSSVLIISIVVASWFWYSLFILWGLVSVFVTYLHFEKMLNTLIMKIGEKIEDIGGWLKKMYRKMSRLWINKEPGLPVVDPRLDPRGQVPNPYQPRPI